MSGHKGTQPDRGSRQARRVLFALTDQVQREYADELANLRRRGLELFLQTSPEVAMAQVAAMRPAVVVVGTDVGPMEWFEFVTQLAGQCKDLDAQVIVLPNKSDPFSPVLRFRDPKTGTLTGRYISDRLHLDDIVWAVCAVAGAEEGAAPRPRAHGSGPIQLPTLDPSDRKAH